MGFGGRTCEENSCGLLGAILDVFACCSCYHVHCARQPGQLTAHVNGFHVQHSASHDRVVLPMSDGHVERRGMPMYEFYGVIDTVEMEHFTIGTDHIKTVRKALDVWGDFSTKNYERVFAEGMASERPGKDRGMVSSVDRCCVLLRNLNGLDLKKSRLTCVQVPRADTHEKSS